MAQVSFEPGTSRSRFLRSTRCATLAGTGKWDWQKSCSQSNAAQIKDFISVCHANRSFVFRDERSICLHLSAFEKTENCSTSTPRGTRVVRRYAGILAVPDFFLPARFYRWHSLRTIEITDYVYMYWKNIVFFWVCSLATVFSRSTSVKKVEKRWCRCKLHALVHLTIGS